MTVWFLSYLLKWMLEIREKCCSCNEQHFFKLGTTFKHIRLCSIWGKFLGGFS